MYKISRIFIYLLVLCSIIVLSGCSNSPSVSNPSANETKPAAADTKVGEPKNTSQPTQNTGDTATQKQEPSAEKLGDVLKPEQLKLSSSDYQTINNVLKDRKNISDISWSKGKNLVVFALYKEASGDDTAALYMWKVGKTEPSIVDIPKDRFGEFFWSPNEEYIIADAGTSVVRNAYVISTNDCKVVDQFVYIFKAVWSPDSKIIAIGRKNNTKTIVDTELDGSVDVVLHDFMTKKDKLVAEGGAEYYYTPLAFDKDGTLSYQKSYFDNQKKDEILIYSIK